MSDFAPIVPPRPAESHAHALARFVPTALRRLPPTAKTWKLYRVVGLGLISGGLWPCFALQARVRQTITYHARQCELACDLLAEHLPADDVAPAAEAAARSHVPQTYRRVSGVLFATAVVVLGVWLTRLPKFSDALHWWNGPRDALGLTAAGLLGAAYLVNVLQLNRQIVAMQQFALAFNAAVEGRLPPVASPPLVYGLRPTSLITGVVGSVFGPVWALPMLLTWAALASFAEASVLGLRVRLAERLTALTGVEPVVPNQDICANVDCRASLSIDAQFCARCGQTVDRAPA